MTSHAAVPLSSPSWGAAPVVPLARAATRIGSRPRPRAAAWRGPRMRAGVAGGAALLALWALLVALFVAAVAEPGARLHREAGRPAVASVRAAAP